MNENYLQTLDRHKINKAFVEACFRNEQDLVNYLLNSPELKHHANINFDNDDGLSQAIMQGHFDLVKYLLTSKDLVVCANLTSNGFEPFKLACKSGKLEIVQFLFTLPQVKERFNIFREIGIIDAVYKDQKEVLKFLLVDLRNEAYTDRLYNNAFKDAYMYEKLDLLEFLIIDLKLEKNKEVINYLTEQENASHNVYKRHRDFLEKVNQYFIIGEHNKLEEDLNNKNNNNKTTKAKL